LEEIFKGLLNIDFFISNKNGKTKITSQIIKFIGRIFN
jgi:hypothetical protein